MFGPTREAVIKAKLKGQNFTWQQTKFMSHFFLPQSKSLNIQTLWTPSVGKVYKISLYNTGSSGLPNLNIKTGIRFGT